MTDAHPTPTMTDDAISGDMIEAAAKALYEVCECGHIAQGSARRDDAWADFCLTEIHREAHAQYIKLARAALAAALPIAVARERGWEPVETIPRAAGSRIRALVETEIVMEEFVPAVLTGGWKRCFQNDRIIGWKPAIRSGNGGE